MESLQKSAHLSVGVKGEELAVGYLLRQGYLILETNWSFKHKELDIIALHGEELVIVEVKTRTEPVYDDPGMSVNRKKQRNIISAAHAYIRYHRMDREVRFDIIWIRVDTFGHTHLEHIPHAFIPVL